MNFLILLFGLALLVVGGELVVTNGVRVAEHFRISPMIIGLTVVAIGTSLPELAVGIDGMRRGVGDIVLGNVVGTDIVNILLILGLSALIRPIAVPPGILKIDLPMMTISSAFFLFLAWNGYLGVTDGIILLVAGIIYMTFVLVTARRRDLGEGTIESPDAASSALNHADEMELAESVSLKSAPKPLWLTILLLVIGLAGIVYGADRMLSGAVAIAQQFGVSETLIGLTIVAIGTSAPELVTTIIATIKNERGLAFGNLVGSSTLNLTIILGLSLLFTPYSIAVNPSLLRVSMPLMVLVGLACVPVFLSGRRMSRLEGGLFVAAYAVYLTYTLVSV